LPIFLQKIKNWIYSLSLPHLPTLTFNPFTKIPRPPKKKSKFYQEDILKLSIEEQHYWNSLYELPKKLAHKCEKSYNTMPLIRFEYESPDSIDFINWRKMIDINNEFIMTHTPIFKVNTLPRIKYQPRFVSNYNNRIKRMELEKLKKELYEYKPEILVKEKDKITLPDDIKQQCELIFEIHKILKNSSLKMQITYEPNIHPNNILYIPKHSVIELEKHLFNHINTQFKNWH
jgi:hypothetical protein